MQINVKQLSNNINELSNTISEYSNTVNAYYHEIRNAENYANTNKTQKFFNKTKEEEQSIKIFLSELNETKKIYSYTINQYSSLGNIINFNLNRRNILDQRFSSIINNLYSIKQNLYSINTYRCPELSYEINDALNQINNTINSIKECQKSNNNALNTIQSTEDNIKEMLNNNQIQNLTETDIIEFM